MSVSTLKSKYSLSLRTDSIEMDLSCFISREPTIILMHMYIYFQHLLIISTVEFAFYLHERNTTSSIHQYDSGYLTNLRCINDIVLQKSNEFGPQHAFVLYKCPAMTHSKARIKKISHRHCIRQLTEYI